MGCPSGLGYLLILASWTKLQLDIEKLAAIVYMSFSFRISLIYSSA